MGNSIDYEYDDYRDYHPDGDSVLLMLAKS